MFVDFADRKIDLIPNLRPALRCGAEIRVGEIGQVHGQLPRQPGTVEAGFVDIRDGRFMSRAEAARWLSIPGIDSLHSQTHARLQSELHE